MNYVRWYDKNPDLRDVFEFIEGLGREYQSVIAKDIIQILMQDFNLNLDEKINSISQNYKYKCKRWYDENIDLFTSFEIIKGLSEEMQQNVVRKIIETALFIYLEEGVDSGKS